jgi:hypothetical protein
MADYRLSKRLWDEVGDSFNRQFANVMEQEDTLKLPWLAGTYSLRRGDLDALITDFEQLVRHAGYDINQESGSCASSLARYPMPCMHTYIVRPMPPQCDL